MSRRLAELMNEKILREGARGKARLSLAAGKSEKMIDRYRKHQSKPPTDVARQLALACGCTEREADELALECSLVAKAG
jgi:hypothetical protein